MTQLIVITGANSGIGLETARQLYADDHSLIFGSRNQQRNQEAVKNIQQSRPLSKGAIKQCPLDLTVRQSVEKFADFIKQQFSHIDILINNAGLIKKEREIGEKGAEMTYLSNNLGHFYLTYLLFGLLSKSKEARILNVSSGAHFQSTKNMADDLDCSQSWGQWDIYCNSKLGNAMFTVLLNKKLSQSFPNIKTACLDPGVVKTNFFQSTCIMKWFECCCGCCFKKSNQGAVTSLHLSRVEFKQMKSGAFYNSDAQIKEMNSFAQKVQECQKFWSSCQQHYGIKFQI